MAPLIPGKYLLNVMLFFLEGGSSRFSDPFPLSDVLKRLGVVIAHGESRQPDNIHPTENAIAAWGRICQFQPNATGDIGAALSAWLSFLPVTEDNVESLVTYGQLCYFIET